MAADSVFKALLSIGAKDEGATSAIKGINVALIAGGAALTAYSGFAVHSFGKVDVALREAALATGDYQGNIDQLKEAALRMGPAFDEGAGGAARAMSQLIRGGLDAKSAIASLGDANLIAESSGLSLADSASKLTGVLKGYNLEASRSGEVADLAVTGFNNSKASVSDMLDTMERSSPIFSLFSGGAKDAAAVTALLAQNSVTGGQASSVLRGGITQLLAPTAETAKVFEKYNFHVADLIPGIENLTTAQRAQLKTLQETDETGEQTVAFLQGLGLELPPLSDLFLALAKSGMTSMEMLDVLGPTAGPVLAKALGDGGKALEDLKTKMDASQGAAKEWVDTVGESFPETLATFKSALGNVGDVVGSRLTPAVTTGTKALTSVVNVFNDLPGPAQTAISYMIGVGGVAGSLTGTFLQLAPVIEQARGALKLLGPIAAKVGSIFTTVLLPVIAVAATAFAAWKLGEWLYNNSAAVRVFGDAIGGAVAALGRWTGLISDQGALTAQQQARLETDLHAKAVAALSKEFGLNAEEIAKLEDPVARLRDLRKSSKVAVEEETEAKRVGARVTADVVIPLTDEEKSRIEAVTEARRELAAAIKGIDRRDEVAKIQDSIRVFDQIHGILRDGVVTLDEYNSAVDAVTEAERDGTLKGRDLLAAKQLLESAFLRLKVVIPDVAAEGSHWDDVLGDLTETSKRFTDVQIPLPDHIRRTNDVLDDQALAAKSVDDLIHQLIPDLGQWADQEVELQRKIAAGLDLNGDYADALALLRQRFHELHPEFEGTIDDFRRAEDAALRSKEAVSQFVEGVSHDLAAALVGTQTWADAWGNIWDNLMNQLTDWVASFLNNIIGGILGGLGAGSFSSGFLSGFGSLGTQGGNVFGSAFGNSAGGWLAGLFGGGAPVATVPGVSAPLFGLGGDLIAGASTTGTQAGAGFGATFMSALAAIPVWGWAAIAGGIAVAVFWDSFTTSRAEAVANSYMHDVGVEVSETLINTIKQIIKDQSGSIWTALGQSAADSTKQWRALGLTVGDLIAELTQAGNLAANWGTQVGDTWSGVQGLIHRVLISFDEDAITSEAAVAALRSAFESMNAAVAAGQITQEQYMEQALRVQGWAQGLGLDLSSLTDLMNAFGDAVDETGGKLRELSEIGDELGGVLEAAGIEGEDALSKIRAAIDSGTLSAKFLKDELGLTHDEIRALKLALIEAGFAVGQFLTPFGVELGILQAGGHKLADILKIPIHDAMQLLRTAARDLNIDFQNLTQEGVEALAERMGIGGGRMRQILEAMGLDVDNLNFKFKSMGKKTSGEFGFHSSVTHSSGALGETVFDDVVEGFELDRIAAVLFSEEGLGAVIAKFDDVEEVNARVTRNIGDAWRGLADLLDQLFDVHTVLIDEFGQIGAAAAASAALAESSYVRAASRIAGFQLSNGLVLAAGGGVFRPAVQIGESAQIQQLIASMAARDSVPMAIPAHDQNVTLVLNGLPIEAELRRMIRSEMRRAR